MVTAKDDQVTSTVISLGTGNKCLGDGKRSEKGDVIHDSHAEVIARRCFLKFLYTQLWEFHSGRDSIFFSENLGNKFLIKQCYSFHMYVSQNLCGDSSVYPRDLDIRTGSKPVPGQLAQDYV
eukprot:TRINITY_DN7117_c0_g2_i5.p1 TRINITY_DN7117_c0_g2~~TRINITY_DN7117_c0_g2_i5.p1  ORF type:complete len:122 (+),score=16.44 TRINITY_DN7117_c0_g2_i5:160-525(+)